MSQTLQMRDSRLDVFRILATCTVMGVHFFLNNGFYTAPLLGGRMFLLAALRYACMVCVPSFMVLTGYLSWRKTLRPGYWKGLVPILGLYGIACCFYALFNLVRDPELVSLSRFIRNVLGYSGTYYSWYVGFYIGFCLLIPFFNLLYHGLTSQRQKQLLLLILLTLTSLPSVTNLYIPLLPTFWVPMYPILYYFIGCYLQEYKPYLKKRYLFPLFCVLCLLTAAVTYWRSHGDVFNGFSNWCDLPIVILTVLFSMFCLELPPASPGVARWLSWLSSLSFGAYLASSIPDQTIYPWLIAHMGAPHLLLPYFIPAVGCSILCSFVLSWIYNKIYACLRFMIKKAKK